MEMFSKWLKPYLPRSLFGRASAIMIVPVVLIQVVVGVVLVERLFQNVSGQMSGAVALDINYLISKFENDAPDVVQAAEALEITMGQGGEAGPDRRQFIDIAGITVVQTLRNNVRGIMQVDLVEGGDYAILQVKTPKSDLKFKVLRQRLSATNPHQLLVIMMIAAFLITGLSILFLRNQVQPINRLAKAAEAFGKGWSLPLKPRGASEVRAAAKAFLSMRGRIERQVEQRNLMLSGLSHDLRTPLTRLKLSVSLMEPDPETELMQRDLDEMAEILDEFLAFSSGDSGEVTESVAPKPLAEKLVENYRRAGDAVSLVYAGNTLDDSPVKIRRMAVQRAVGNLLGNAQKWGDQTRLTLYIGTGFIEFIVEDNGPGISQQERENALKPFTRLDAARNQDKGSGVGLGLAIASDVARSHGGAMTLGQSDDLGGLKINFRIPR
ncbi:MAG: HAMP domain-containing protein [Rhodobacteraceae bacterium]|nr:HAMP domain-containing protein [Paracoccaceae bacterium]